MSSEFVGKPVQLLECRLRNDGLDERCRQLL
jgi:hypothetical protein